jgi:hypothetical protein
MGLMSVRNYDILIHVSTDIVAIELVLLLHKMTRLKNL